MRSKETLKYSSPRRTPGSSSLNFLDSGFRRNDKSAIDQRRPKGFTLLETLVALAIIGIAMAAAMRSNRFAIDTVGDLRTRTAASWVAQNVSNQLLASRLFPELGTVGGDATQGNQAFKWIQETSITPNYSMRRVEIKVFLPEDTEHVIVRQVSYVARNQD